jgi:hypothetical protein
VVFRFSKKMMRKQQPHRSERRFSPEFGKIDAPAKAASIQTQAFCRSLVKSMRKQKPKQAVRWQANGILGQRRKAAS